MELRLRLIKTKNINMLRSAKKSERHSHKGRFPQGPQPSFFKWSIIGSQADTRLIESSLLKLLGYFVLCQLPPGRAWDVRILKLLEPLEVIEIKNIPIISTVMTNIFLSN